MKRRQFLKVAGLGAAGTAAVAAPAVTQSMPDIKWRLTSSFPKSLDTLFGATVAFAKAVGEATDNKFQIEVFAAGEIVPALQALDAVSNGTVEMCQTAGYYYVGKDPTFAIGTSLPFGLNSRMQTSWLQVGGGAALFNDFLKKYNLIAFAAGNTGCQMGGWFRKEIKEVADLQGLKMRVGGIAGNVFAKLGVVPQQVGAGDIYSALEKGTVDAAEFVGPYDDERLGFQKVAKYYYYPGFFDAGPTIHHMVNMAKWEQLPPAYKSLIKTASSMANEEMQARYDAYNPPAIKRLVAGGTQLRAFSPAILDAAYKAANDLYAEISATNPAFKTMYDAMVAYRGDEYAWWQVAELTYDNYMVRSRNRN